MDVDVSGLVADYFSHQLQVFTVDDFCKYLRKNNIRFSKDQGDSVLRSSELVFPLVNDQFVTRAGVFTGQFFSFKPSLEEVRKGLFILGHRCMPFINPEITPDRIRIFAKDKILSSQTEKFSLNLALDVFGFFGEGYSLSYIFNDMANQQYSIASVVKNNLPKETRLTCWPLNCFGPDITFEFGDRILCKVVDWSSSLVEISVVKKNENPLSISFEDVERDEWYSTFEETLLKSMETHGPGASIEEQLAFLYLENFGRLAIRNCGSSEEFLAHTDKIEIRPFGVESRLWLKGEDIPFSGSWNTEATGKAMISEIAKMFSPAIIDSYIWRAIYDANEKKCEISEEDFENISYLIFPSSLELAPAERKTLLLNIKKRHDIILRQFDKETDRPIAYLRDRILSLFSDVSTLLCEIGCSCEQYDEFPQQEMVILTQLFSHLANIIEELQNLFLRSQFPIEDTLVSLDGMYETFSDISYPLKKTLKEINFRKVDIKK